MSLEEYSTMYQDLFEYNDWKSYKIVNNKYYFNDIGTENFVDQVEILDEMVNNG
jgi:hypothetical protein